MVFEEFLTISKGILNFIQTNILYFFFSFVIIIFFYIIKYLIQSQKESKPYPVKNLPKNHIIYENPPKQNLEHKTGIEEQKLDVPPELPELSKEEIGNILGVK